MSIQCFYSNSLLLRRADYDSLSHIEDHVHRVYAAMVLALDRAVGRVLAAVREAGLEDNTLIVFTSDNGGANYVNIKVLQFGLLYCICTQYSFVNAGYQ